MRHHARRVEASAVLRQAAIRTMARDTAQWLLDQIYPRTCGSCGRIDTGFCPPCSQELAALPQDVQRRNLEALDSFCATGEHDGILGKAVRSFKYEDVKELSQGLAKRIIVLFHEQPWQIDAVVPVPLHAERLQARGYNQSQLLSSELAQACGLAHRPGWLQRTRNTPQQAQLSSAERLRNVQGAFVAAPEVLEQRILLVDDVLTTGATLRECAGALRAAGAIAIHGIALSCTKGTTDWRWSWK